MNPRQQAKDFDRHFTPEPLVDALNGAFGKQQLGVRAVHAKGINLKRSSPSKSASEVSKAPHLQQTSVPITVQLSAFTGFPSIADTDKLASPRGMAIKFHLRTAPIQISLPTHSMAFRQRPPDEFRELLVAMVSSGPEVAKPSPLDAFLVAHPAAKRFLESQIPPPRSHATVSYFGVNTFKLTNVEGAVTLGRYQIRPTTGEESLTDAEVESAWPDYLSKEIRERISPDPVGFRLLLQIADEGDDLDDASITWPDTCRQIELGTIVIDQVVA